MKPYNKPCLELLEAECQQIVAVSLQEGSADPSAEVLTKEADSWDIWEEN